MIVESHVTVTIAEEAIAGLSGAQKTLPSKLFYDEEGCRLFGEITRLPEYYVTRTERALLQKITSKLPITKDMALVEYGASDEGKAAILLDLFEVAAYVPIDVAGPALLDLRQRLARSRPNLQVVPIEADFLKPLTLPPDLPGKERFGFFPGSTIGNLDPSTACTFLRQMAVTLGPMAQVLIGVDLRKDASILVPAYDDAQGVTAAFNLNILRHLNRVAGSNFDLDAFTHRAIWNPVESRIEMYLVSTKRQTVVIADTQFNFEQGDTIHTENSYKHSIDGFSALAAKAGWTSTRNWADEDGLFSLHLLAA